MTTDTQLRGIAEAIAARLVDGRIADAVALLDGLHPADQADVVIELDEDAQQQLIDALSPDQLAAILEYLEDEERSDIVEDLAPGRLAPVLDRMDDDDAVDLLQDLEPERAQEVLARMVDAAGVAPLLCHDEDSAGGIMTRGFVAVPQSLTAEEAIAVLRRAKPDAEKAYYLYVVDGTGRLQGVLGLRDLIVAEPTARVTTLMQRDVHSVLLGTDQEECARLIAHYDLLALPVVDADNRLVGVLTVDDLIDVVEDEATEDMYRMAGIQGEERVFSPVPSSVRRRLPWLYVNLCTAFVAAATVSLFEGTIAEFAVLAALMPMVAGLGGNAGTQTITLMVRSLALGEVAPREILPALRKEVLVGLTNGVAVGGVLGLVVGLVTGNIILGMVLGSALVLNLLAAATAGVIVPLTLKAWHIDPALASSIFTTMVTDVLGFFFLGLATVFIARL
jgi:magnesium transporter